MPASELSVYPSILRTAVADGVQVWPLGNAGVVLATSVGRIAVDPWLSGWLETASPANPQPVTRQRAARLTPAELASLVDAVLITHEHPDHLDPGLSADITRARIPVIVPDGCVSMAASLGYPDDLLRALPVGRLLQVAGFEVSPVAVSHAFASESFGHYTEWVDEQGAHHAVGYLIRGGGRVLFHGGDLVMSRGLEQVLRQKGVDTCLLPINGRDWLREQAGLVGNLDGREAADLAASCGAEIVIPVHFDGVVGNTASPGDIVAYAADRYPGLSVLLPGVSGVHLPPRQTS